MSKAARMRVGVILLTGLLCAAPAAAATESFDGDPDENPATLHTQPPVLGTPAKQPFSAPFSGTINGIFYTDALMAAGFDVASSILGYEPSMTVDPLDPNRIAMVAFSGSSWASGGNSSIFTSGDGGNSWAYTVSIPPPPGIVTNINCPCDQTIDWGRDGVLSASSLLSKIGSRTSVPMHRSG